MTIFTLKRSIIANTAILGTLYNDKGLEVAKTLELPFFNNINDFSCIPFGEYHCKKDNTGNYRYWKINGVENRVGVEFHNGNYASDSNGCILLGQAWSIMRNEKTNQMELAVTSSKPTFKKILDNDLIPNEFSLKIIS